MANVERCVHMYKNISDGRYVVGTKQTLKAIKTEDATVVYLAKDCDSEIKDRIKSSCLKHGIECHMVPGMKELGKACNISLSAAVACNIK